MKRLLVSLICIAGLSISIAQAGTPKTSLEDIMLLVGRGISDETIMVFLKTRKIGFTPDAEDIDKLLVSGLSQEAIRYILRQTATYSTSSYSYQTTTYVDPYPPYYSRSSFYLGYSSYPYTWFGNNYGGVHYASLRHGGIHNLRHNNHGYLSRRVHSGEHAGAHNTNHRLGHNTATGIRHGGSRYTVAHRGRQHSVRHTSRSSTHRSGYSRGHGGTHRGSHGSGHSRGH